MKKSVLILLTFVPILVGFLINFSIMVPVIGSVSFTLLPLATTVFWFYLGNKFAQSGWNVISSVLIANATGILSLLIYIWQFWFRAADTRNLVLAALSQYFSASVPMYLFGWIITAFGSQTYTIMLSMQIFAVVFMMLVFACGFWWGKHRTRN